MDWPDSLIAMVRVVKRTMCWVSGQSVLGIPLDLPLRFGMLGALYALLCVRVPRRHAVAVCMALLLGSELFEIFAVRNLGRPAPPDWGDLADILSGLAGIGAADLAWRWRLRKK